MKAKEKRPTFITMVALRKMSEDELVELSVKRKYATKMEVYRMARPDLLARIMRLQLDAKNQL